MDVIRKKSPFRSLSHSLPILILLFSLPFTMYLLSQRLTIRQDAEEKAGIYVISNAQKALPGETLSLEVVVNTGEESVNMVQVNLAYPPSKLTPIGIDTHGTAFDVETEYFARGGLVKLGREASEAVSGKKRVAIIRFQTNEEIEYTEITATPGSVILRSGDGQNILGQNILVSPYPPPEIAQTAGPKPLWEILWTSISDGFSNLFGRFIS